MIGRAQKDLRPPVPRLAVVVLSLACEPGLVDAVRSVIDQRPEPEVVVVNSGGGGAERVLGEAGFAELKVIERPERLNPGAVRNLGVEATSAPFVAFLAADCVAEPGWVEGRLRAHEAGAPAVASLLTNLYPDSRSACASALLLHHRRMPHTHPDRRIALGLSFSRTLLAGLGPFQEGLRAGEDSEYKWRVHMAEQKVVMAEGVRTAHRNPRTVRALLRDQFARGARQARARTALGVHRRRVLLLPLEAIADAQRAWRWTRAERDPAVRRRIRRGWPLLLPAAAAYAAGSLGANWTDGRWAP